MPLIRGAVAGPRDHASSTFPAPGPSQVRWRGRQNCPALIAGAPLHRAHKVGDALLPCVLEDGLTQRSCGQEVWGMHLLSRAWSVLSFSGDLKDSVSRQPDSSGRKAQGNVGTTGREDAGVCSI